MLACFSAPGAPPSMENDCGAGYASARAGRRRTRGYSKRFWGEMLAPCDSCRLLSPRSLTGAKWADGWRGLEVQSKEHCQSLPPARPITVVGFGARPAGAASAVARRCG